MAEIVKQDQVHGNTAEAADVLTGSRHSELAGLLLHIRDISRSLTEQQRLQVVARVADHSASDGMALSKDLKLNSAQIREIFLDDAFLFKHRALASEFFDLCRGANLLSKESDLNSAAERYNQLEHDLKKRPEIIHAFQQRAIFEEQIRPLITEIDRVYSAFLRDRRLAPTNGGLNSMFLKPVNWITKYRMIDAGQYFRREVFELLGRHANNPYRDPPSDKEAAFYPPLLSPFHIETLFFVHNIDRDDPVVQNELKRTRRLLDPLTAPLQQDAATAVLREHLTSSVVNDDIDEFLSGERIFALDHFGVSLEFNETTRRFRLQASKSPEDDEFRSLALLLLEKWPIPFQPCNQNTFADYGLGFSLSEKDGWVRIIDRNGRAQTPWLWQFLSSDSVADCPWFVGTPAGHDQSILFTLAPGGGKPAPYQGDQIPTEWQFNGKIFSSIASWRQVLDWLNSVQDPLNLPEQVAPQVAHINQRAEQLGDSSLAHTVNLLIRSSPELLLPSLAAKSDLSPSTEALKLFNLAFPRLALRSRVMQMNERLMRAATLPLQLLKRSTSSPRFKQAEHFQLKGGGVLNLLDRRILLTSGDKLDAPLIRGLYTKCEPDSMTWHLADYPLRCAPVEPTRCITLNLRARGLPNEIALPAPINSELIAERCFALSSNREAQSIPTSKSADGTSIISSAPFKLKGIKYSLLVGNNTCELPDLSEGQYQSLVRAHTARHGKDIVEPIGPLPSDLKDLASSLREVPLLERLCLAEERLRDLFWYDIHNDEVSSRKIGQPFERKIAEMELRLDELKRRWFSSVPDERKYAGVCADFAELGVAVLRQSGFAAGLARAFVPEGNRVRQRGAHALCFALWPNSSGKLEPLLVDPTPSIMGFFEAFLGARFSVNASPLRSRIRKAQFIENQEQASRESAPVVFPISGALDTLSNGALEKAVNVVLAGGVLRCDLELCQQLVASYLYTPYRFTNWRSNEAVEKLAAFLSYEVQRSGKASPAVDAEAQRLAGADLLKFLEQSAQQIIERGLASSQAEGLAHLQKLFGLVPQCFQGDSFQSVLLLLRYLGAA